MSRRWGLQRLKQRLNWDHGGLDLGEIQEFIAMKSLKETPYETIPRKIMS